MSNNNLTLNFGREVVYEGDVVSPRILNDLINSFLDYKNNPNEETLAELRFTFVNIVQNNKFGRSHMTSAQFGLYLLNQFGDNIGEESKSELIDFIAFKSEQEFEEFALLGKGYYSEVYKEIIGGLTAFTI